jgi:hypothetical protein
MDKFWENYITTRPADSKGAFDAFKQMNQDPRPTIPGPRYAKAEFSPVFDPDLEQSEFLRPGETLEDWKPNPFLKPHAEGGRAGYTGGGPIDVLDPQFKLADAIKAYRDYYSGSGKKKRKIPFKTFFRIYAKENFAQGGSAGQLVRPTVDGSRPGYLGEEYKKKTIYKKRQEAQELGLVYDKKTKRFRKSQAAQGARYTIDQIAKINKNLEDFPGITLKKGGGRSLSWYVRLRMQKGDNTMYEYKPATESNIKKFKQKQKNFMKINYPNVLSNIDFEDLRFLDENINLSAKDFAKVLNDKGKTTIRGYSWTKDTVMKLQGDLEISKYIQLEGASGKLRPINVAKKIVRDNNPNDLKRFNQISDISMRNKAIRHKASRIKAETTQLQTSGTFQGITKSREGSLWKNYYESHKRGDRIKIGGEFNGKNLSHRKNWPRNPDGTINWFLKDKTTKKPAWQMVEFTDMETPKGEVTFKYDNLKTQVDDAFEPGFFTRSTSPYIAQKELYGKNIMFEGKSMPVGKVLAKNAIIKDFQSKPGNAGKMPAEKYIQDRMRIWSPSQVHHWGEGGVGRNPYQVQRTSRLANQAVNAAEMTYKTALKNAGKDTAKIKTAKDNFIKSIEDISGKYGGIQYTVDGKVVGTKASEASTLAVAGQEADLLKHKDFKGYLNSRLKDTYARNQAKLFEKMGIKIADMCSNLVAGGGRIGFANKVCGMELVESNSDEFLRLSEQKMNEPFEFKGTKYNSFNEFAKTKPGLWKNLTRSAAKFGRYAASPTTLLGGEVWFTVLDTMASMQKGIKFNEALDNAFFLYPFDQGKKNMLAKGKELGWSNAQIQDATQVFNLAENQMNIEKTEQNINTLGQWKEDKSVAPFGISAGMGQQSYTDIEGDIERTKIYLSSLQKKQDDAWSNYQSGKTEEQIEKGFGLPYKLGEELRREELIKARDEDKEKVRPLMSDVWNIFPSIWSPSQNTWAWDTIKEKYKLQGVSGFLPGGDKELREKAKAQGISPWLFGMSAADLAEYNKKRKFRTKEELKEGPLTPKEMADLTRDKYLRYMYPTLGKTFEAGGRAGYMGGGIAGIRKPDAIPPERQGLRSLYINDKDY